MANRLDKTAADYIAIAIGPALIMSMVGSLVFFLVELYYRGDYVDRLHWILACFVFASVLIGRISIESGTARAMLFALPLALSVGLGIAFYVEHSGPWASIGLYLDWAMLGVIWWCAHKLTWDCTFIDEQQADTGEGLLQTMGADGEASETPTAIAERIAAQQVAARWRQLPGTNDDDADDRTKPWWERWLAQDERPHAPGVWVVYFSLAALPIFGLGQLLIPAASEDRRQYVFQLLAIYVASGLGLLLTTSFLGMRRYLRHRFVEMPPRVAGKWILMGCGLGLGLLALAMLLPRPNAEYAWASITGTVGSPQRQATRVAPPGGSGGQDPQKKARSSTTTEKGSKQPGTGDAKTGGAKTGSSGKSTGDGGGDSSSKTSAGSDGGKSPDGQAGAKTSGSDGGSKTSGDSADGKTSDSGDGKSQAGKTGTAKSASSKTGSSGGSDAKSQDASDGARKSDESGDEGQEEREEGKSSEDAASDSSSSSRSNFRPLETVTSALSWLPTMFKWILHGAIVLTVAYLVWRHRTELWSALRGLWNDLRNLLAGLLGGKKRVAPAASQAVPAVTGPRGRPFADYPNPFTSGLAGRLTADQLVAYTFEALEAWASERGLPRDPNTTPLEFAAELAASAAPLADPVRQLAQWYCQVAYAPGTLRLDPRVELEQLWRLLERG